ncbi:hypothetical protein ACFCYB_01590 [Streptomyces sp. NPDC056309]|uniref:hypothetical protein n=1 Tax=unclassified Streptomyces TaxID=2593676 RepID=UPI0035D6EA94
MPENAPQPPETPSPTPEPDPPGGSPSVPSGRVARWRRYLPLGDGNFTATAIIAPVVVAVVVLAVTNGFGWIDDQFKDDKPDLYVTGSRSPRAAVSERPTPSAPATPSEDSPAPAAPAASPSEPASPPPSPAEGRPADQSEAGEKGINSLRDSYTCPWQAYVVNRPSGAFTGPPALADGSPDPAVIDDTAGDPGNTHLVIDVQPPDTRPLLIKELRIKVLRRAPAPSPDRATLVGLDSGQCGTSPTTVKAAADLDGNADFATVRYSGGPSLPQEITGGRTLSIALTVSTRSADCVWVPELVWAKDGEVRTTEFRIGGRDFHTVAADGLPRLAWKQDLNTRQWSVTVFDESVLR